MERVVVVETDGDARERICARLLADGRETVWCSTREGALELLRIGADALLLGRTQPSGVGIAILQELRTIDSLIPTVVIAGSTEEALGALRAGALFVTRYPTSPEKLSRLMGRALRTRERARSKPGPAPESSATSELLPRDIAFVELDRSAVAHAIRHALEMRATAKVDH